jgi:hypothetical protein
MKKLGRSQLGTGTGTTIYTVPTGQRCQVEDITIANTTSLAATCSIHLVPSGGSAAANNAMFGTVTIPANTTIQWTGMQVLNAGDFIQGIAGAATSITVHISGDEIRSGI